MPCRDYMDDYPPREVVVPDLTLARKWMLRCFVAETGNNTELMDLDRLSAILCGILNKTSSTQLRNYSKELQEWWKNHQEADAKAEKAKKEREDRAKLIEKMSPRDKRLLGL